MFKLRTLVLGASLFALAAISAAAPAVNAGSSVANRTTVAASVAAALQADRCTNATQSDGSPIPGALVAQSSREPICCGQCYVKGTNIRGCLLKYRDRDETYCSPCN